MQVCTQHHVRSSSAGSRMELSSLPSFDLPAHADASESASLLRSMVSPYPCLADGWPGRKSAPQLKAALEDWHALCPHCRCKY